MKVLKSIIAVIIFYYPLIILLGFVLQPLGGNDTYLLANAAYIILVIAFFGGLILEKLQEIQNFQNCNFKSNEKTEADNQEDNI